MNRVFKTFFNRYKNCCVVISENSKAISGKSNFSKSALITTSIILLSCLASSSISALELVGTWTSRYLYDSNENFFLFDDTHIDFSNHRLNSGSSNPTGSIYNSYVNQDISNNSFSIGGMDAAGEMPDSETVYLGYGNLYNGFFQDLKNNEKVGFVESISASENNGTYTYTVKYSKVSKNDVGLINIRYHETETFTCNSTDENCPIFTGSLTASSNKEEIEQLASQISSYLTGSDSSSGTEDRYTYNGSASKRLTGVSAGEISADSLDAVNGSQLYELQQKITEGSGGSEYLSINATDEAADPTTSAKAQGAHSMAVGEEAVSSGTNSVAMGYKATVAADHSVALGANATVAATDVLSSDTHGVVSVGNSDAANGFKRRIINVADGVNASDAATVGQVTTISRDNLQKGVQDVLGVTVTDADGKLTAGNIGQTGQTTVSGAIASIKSSVDSINNGSFTEGATNKVQEIARNSVKVESSTTNVLSVVGTTDDTGTTTYKLSILSDGTVGGTQDGRLVTGSTVAAETRVASDGTYVRQANSAAANLAALDTQVGTNAGNIATLQTSVDNINAGAFTETTENTIKQLAGQGVRVASASDDYITIETVTENNATTYRLTVKSDGTVGGQLGGHLVTGNTVAAETRVASDGTYVKQTESAAKNLTSLDNAVTSLDGAVTRIDSAVTEHEQEIAKNASDIAANATAITGKANVNADNIEVASWQTKLGNGKAEANNTGLVTGGTLHASLQGKANTDLSNLSEGAANTITSLAQGAVEVVSGKNTTVTKGSNGNAVTYAVNVAADGTVNGDNDAGIVTGTTVASALDKAIGDAFTNIGTAGSDQQNAIRDAAKDAVKVSASDGSLITVTPTTDEKNHTTTYSVGLQMAEELSADAAGLVTGKMVFEGLNGLATAASLTSDNVSAWQQKLGNGAIAENNGGLVTGGTVYDAIAQTFEDLPGSVGGEVIKDQAQAAINVKADEKSGNFLQVTKTTDDQANVDTYAVGLTMADGISATTDGLVSAKTVFDEVRPTTNGRFIANNVSTAENLGKLDSAVATNTDNIGALQTTVGAINQGNFSEAASSQITSLAQGAVKVVSGSNTTVTQGKDGNALTYAVNVTADGTVHGDKDSGIVTGSTVASALDKAIGDAFTKIGTEGSEQQNAIRDAAKDAVKVSASDGSLITVTPTTDVKNHTTTYSVGLHMADGLTADATGLVTGKMVFEGLNGLATATSLTPDNVGAWQKKLGNGAIAEGNGGLVTGGTVYDAISDSFENLPGTAGGEVIKDQAQTAIAVTADENSADYLQVVKNEDKQSNVDTYSVGLKMANGIDSATDGLVSAKTVYDEVRPTDGRYVRNGATTAANLSALDTELGNVNQTVNKVQGTVFDADGNLQLATHSLDNLTQAGLDRLKNATSLQGDAFITVEASDSTDGATRNYSLVLKTTETAGEGENALVTSNTLAEELKAHSDSTNAAVAESLAAKADLDAGNLTAEHVQKWQAALGTGTVAANDGGLVTGGTLFAEVRPTEEGTYVGADQTTGENLTSLDKGLVTLNEELGNKAEIDASNIKVDAWRSVLGGSIASGDAGLGFVTGQAVHQWSTPGTRTEPYFAISSDNTVAENLVALDDKLGQVQQSIPTNGLDTSLGNLTEDGKDVIAGIANDSLQLNGSGLITVEKGENGFTIGGVTGGEIAQNNAGLVTGDQVWDALQDVELSEEAVQNAINEALTNNETFQQAVSEAVTNNSNVQAVVENALKNEQNLDFIAENMDATGTVSSEDTKAVSGQTVHQYLHADSMGLGSNNQVSGTGSFAYGSNNVVMPNKTRAPGDTDAGAFGSGNTVAANHSYAFGSGNTVSAENSYAIGNGNRIESTGTNTFVLGSNVTTDATNAVVLGAGSEGVSNAVSVGSSTSKRKIVNVERGEVSAGSSDAVTGGQLYETQQAIAENSRSIDRVAHTLKRDIDRAAANAAAMAALQPLGLDDEHKWSAAAGVGNYSGEQALAIGVFYKPTENIMVNVAGSAATGGDTMVNAGLAYRFGAPSTYGDMSTSALKQKVVALSDHNRALEAQLRSAQDREESMAQRVEKSREELETLKKEIELMKELLGLRIENGEPVLKRTSLKK